MKCLPVRDGVVCVPDSSGEVIVGGRTMKFDFDKDIGPVVLRADGTPRKNLPGPRHPFWNELQQWLVLNVQKKG